MDTELYKRVKDELCPNDHWDLTDAIKRLLKLQINRLPQVTVSAEETRYPTSPAGMRAFLDTFFARHYFQVQNSMLDYMTSEEFLNLVSGQELRILDIGSGPAVACLAITDMLASIFKHLRGLNQVFKSNMVSMNYVLNDTAGICLGTGRESIRSYFSLIHQNSCELLHATTLAIEKGFPLNISQLKRICQNTGDYDIVILSYVLNPLNEQLGLRGIADGLSQVESLCKPEGRILILQDKFREHLTRRVAGAIGRPCHKEVLSQHVHSMENENELFTYTYYNCFFAPKSKVVEYNAEFV